MDLRAKPHTLGWLKTCSRPKNINTTCTTQEKKNREFSVGYKVLVLLLSSSAKLLNKWQDPFEITR